MEAVRLTLQGAEVDRFADEFVGTKATRAGRSLNKRAARNFHRYDGDGFTKVAYERGAAAQDSWLMVSVLVERVAADTSTVAVFVGGGGEGPFKLEDLNMTRLLRGRDAVGAAGRITTVLQDVEEVAESLDLAVETTWTGDRDSESPLARLAHEIFEG